MKFRKNDFGVENRPLSGLCGTGDIPGIPKVGYESYHKRHRPSASTVPAPVMQGQSLHMHTKKDDYKDTQLRMGTGRGYTRGMSPRVLRVRVRF